MLVARAYSEAKAGDKHLRVAVELLKDKVTREIFNTGKGQQHLAAFDAHWAKCRGDHRPPLITTFRDKYTAHLGEPKKIEQATYDDLYAFAGETAKAMELLALAARVAERPLDSDPGFASSVEAFWKPWRSKPT